MTAEERGEFLMWVCKQRGAKGVNMRAGWKTTEFWATLIATALSGLFAALSGNETMREIATAMTVVGPAVYAAGRAYLKARAALQSDQVAGRVDAVEQNVEKLLAAIETITAAASAAATKRKPD